MSYSLDFPCATKFSRPHAQIKTRPEDFEVEEYLEVEPLEQGEHVWLWIEKSEQNTEYVAKQLARFAGLRKMDVGFAGLKDRWAVTRQWFSLYLSNRPEPNWDECPIEGVTILSKCRQTKKLRRGEHRGNRFRLVLRGLEHHPDLDRALQQIQERGFPNYFGLQRFGRQGENLTRGAAYFDGKLKANRQQRGFFLSAARSFLFNKLLAEQVESGQWLEPGATCLMAGDLPPEVELSHEEKDILERYPELMAGIYQNRLSMERRPSCIIPEDMSWEWVDRTLCLSFGLPSGVFATAMLQELVCVEDVSGSP